MANASALDPTQMAKPNVWPWVIGGSITVLLLVLVILVIVPYFTPPQQSPLVYGSPGAVQPIPPGGCKCLSDVKVRSPESGPVDQQYQSIESKDNATFCGFEQGGYRWACKPSDCTPACV